MRKANQPAKISQVNANETGDILLSKNARLVRDFRAMIFASQPSIVQEAVLDIMKYEMDNPKEQVFQLPKDIARNEELKSLREDLIQQRDEIRKQGRLTANPFRKVAFQQKDIDLTNSIESLDSEINRIPTYTRNPYTPSTEKMLDRFTKIFLKGKLALAEEIKTFEQRLDPRGLYIIVYEVFGETHRIPIRKAMLYGKESPDQRGVNLPEILESIESEQTEIEFVEEKEGSGVFAQNYVTMLENIIFDKGNLRAIYVRPIDDINPKTGLATPEQIGGLFPYYNKSRYNLERYQIITDPDKANGVKEYKRLVNICTPQCLLYAFDQSKLKNINLESLQNLVTVDYFPKRELSKLAKILKANIQLHYFGMRKQNDDKEGSMMVVREAKYPANAPYGRTIKLALYKKHYFIYDANACNTGKSSLHLIRSIFDRGEFIKATEKGGLFDHIRSVQQEGVNNADISKYHQLPMKLPKVKKDDEESTKEEPEAYTKSHLVFFADTEATVNNKMQFIVKGVQQTVTTGHIAVLHGCITEGWDTSLMFYKLEDMFDRIKEEVNTNEAKDAIIYYHNLKYDFKLMQTNTNLKLSNYVFKDGMLYAVDIRYKGVKLQLRDSMKFVSQPLRTFNKAFELGISKKELIFYELYTKENLCSYNGSVELDYFKEEQLNGNFKHIFNMAGNTLTKVSPMFIDTKNYMNYVVIDNRIVVHKNWMKAVSDDSEGYNFITEPRVTKYGTVKGTYKHLAHYRYYLHYDCKVLSEGLNKFTSELRNALGIEPYKYLTISSLIHNYVMQSGAYEGVHSIYGSTQDFITQARAGGRVCSRFNKRHISYGRSIAFDGVSLYPSAILRLCMEMGLPACKYQLMTDTDTFNAVRKNPNTIYWVGEFKLRKNLKEQQIAFARTNARLSKDKNGNRCIYEDDKYVNTHKLKGLTMHFGSIQFEDLVEHCELCHHNFAGEDCDGSCYVFVKGIYWMDDGLGTYRNKKLGSIVSNLFDMRAATPPGAKNTALKLCLNSIYGKNMQLASKYNYKCVPKEDQMKYIEKNSYKIKDTVDMCGSMLVKQVANTFFDANNIHIATMILEMSKRIMHEIMSVAEDLGITILYTDTDSMHIIDNNGEIEKLRHHFKERYGRELVGSRLGQFHNDFKVNGCDHEKDENGEYIKDSNGKKIYHWDEYATKEYIVGKKVYYCELEAKHAITGEIKKDRVVKFKGVNSHAIKDQINNVYKGDVEAMFKDLISGKEIKFNMCAGDAVMFNMNGAMPYTKSEFTRKHKNGSIDDIEYHGNCSRESIFGY